MSRVAPLLVAMLGLASPASAFTGAELLQADRSFSKGFIFGIGEYKTVVLQSGRNWEKVRLCLIESKLDSNGLYDLVESYLRRHPRYLTLPAVGGILQSFAEMCDPDYKPS